MGVPLYTIFIAAVLLILCWHNLKPTRVDRKMIAIGGSENCAKLSGINPNAFKRFVYTVGDLCAGLRQKSRFRGWIPRLLRWPKGGRWALSPPSSSAVPVEGRRGGLLAR